MDIFFAFPSFTRRVLADFLTWKDVVLLDTAMCAKELRPKFLSVLSAGDFHQPITQCKGISWMDKRNIRAAFLDLDVPDQYGTNNSSEELISWLNKSGHAVKMMQIRTVGLRHTPLEFILAVATKCFNLERLSVIGWKLGALIVVILQACKKLTHLTIFVDDDPITEFVVNSIGAFCTGLTHLYVMGKTDAEIDWSFLHRLRGFHCYSFEGESEHLHNMPGLNELTTSILNGALLAKLLQNSPQMTYLSCLASSLKVSDLEAVRPLLNQLHTLKLGTWDIGGSNDALVLCVVRHAKNLRILHYGLDTFSLLSGEVYSRKLFDRQDEPAAAELPVQQDASPLQELVVASIREAALVQVLEQCPVLKLLHLESLPYDLSEGEVGRLIASRSVLRLHLELRYSIKTEQLQYFRRVPRLQTLMFNIPDNFTAAEVEEALHGCFDQNSTTLRALNLHKCGDKIANLPDLLSRLPQLEKASVSKRSYVDKTAAQTAASRIQSLKTACPRLRELATDLM